MYSTKNCAQFLLAVKDLLKIPTSIDTSARREAHARIGRMHVIIVGAGFSGLCMAIKLKKCGVKFTVIEGETEVGGTWLRNTYPGCACDIPSHLYSFSFAPKSDWTKVYPQQPEILQYLRDCADKFGVRPHIKFNTLVDEAHWDSERNVWKVKATGWRHADRHSARDRSGGSIKTSMELEGDCLVMGCGALAVPSYPKIPGVEKFEGESLHTAQWKADFQPENKRIALIGSAASAIQIVPPLAKSASQLSIFQRTPNYVMPKMDGYFEWWQKFLLSFTLFRVILRWFYYLRQEWFFLIVFTTGSFTVQLARKRYLEVLRHCISDEKLRESVTPSYPMGCKRILLGTQYYEALNQTNVELLTGGIERIVRQGVQLKDGRMVEADAIVYATGFELLAGYPKVYGKTGEELGQKWGDSPEAYLGMAVPDYPNFFILVGPNTGLGHNSIVWMIECQVNYISACVDHLIRTKNKRIEVKKEATDKFNSKIDHMLDGSVWDRKGCESWYQNKSGRVYALWPGTTYRYWWDTLWPSLSDYSVSA